VKKKRGNEKAFFANMNCEKEEMIVSVARQEVVVPAPLRPALPPLRPALRDTFDEQLTRGANMRLLCRMNPDGSHSVYAVPKEETECMSEDE
jgi:hypothetical protein